MIRLLIISISILFISSCNQTDKENELPLENKNIKPTKTPETKIIPDSTGTTKIKRNLDNGMSNKKHLDKNSIYKLKLEKIKKNKKIYEVEKKLTN